MPPSLEVLGGSVRSCSLTKQHLLRSELALETKYFAVERWNRVAPPTATKIFKCFATLFGLVFHSAKLQKFNFKLFFLLRVEFWWQRHSHGRPTATRGEKNPVTPDRSRRPDSTSFPKRPKMLLFNAALTNENTFDCHLFPLHVTGTGHERHNNLNNARPIEIRSAIEFFFLLATPDDRQRQRPHGTTAHKQLKSDAVRTRPLDCAGGATHVLCGVARLS